MKQENIFITNLGKFVLETKHLPAKAATIWGHFDAAMEVKALASSALDIFFADKYETDFAKATEWQI